jgi:hypothetical protein
MRLGRARSISEIPDKTMPGETARRTEITHVYGAAEAREIVLCSMRDYRRRFVGAGPASLG